MSSVSIATIRQRFATKIDAIAGFSENRNPFPNFGRAPNTVAHKRFAVGILSAIGEDDTRQRQSVGIMSRTAIGVKFAYRIRPKDQLIAYDESITTAESVIQSLTNRTSTLYASLQIRFEQMNMELTESGEFNIISLGFSVLHQIPLL